jgi:hypothetical protein
MDILSITCRVPGAAQAERADDAGAKVEGLQQQAAASQAKVDSQLERVAFLEREAADACKRAVQGR